MKPKGSTVVTACQSSPKCLAAWNTVRLSYNQGFFHVKSAPKHLLPTCLGEGTQENPYTFPNAKHPPLNKHGAILSLFHPEFLKRMDSEVIASIMSVPHISHKPIRDELQMENGESHVIYRLHPEKKRQGPYDRFFQSVHLKTSYEHDYFSGEPKRLTPETMQYIVNHPNEVYIFAMPTPDEIYVLPRKGKVKINGVYFHSWHTHTEFLQDDKDYVFAAGTIKGSQFNLRTGHFLLHELPASERAILTKRVDVIFYKALSHDVRFLSSTPKERQLPYTSINAHAEGDSREMVTLGIK